MVTGKYKCFICGKLYSLSRNSKNPQSKLKRETGKYTAISELPIFEHACLRCYKERFTKHKWQKKL